jgi:serine phosphatase RsbU (regulator of sigma subunit)
MHGGDAPHDRVDGPSPRRCGAVVERAASTARRVVDSPPAAVSGRAAGARIGRIAVGVLVAGLVVTGALTAASRSLYDRNESRLLDLRVRELGLVLSSAVSSIQTPLASAAALAEATGGNPRQLRQLLAPSVGPGRQFASVSLWPLGRRTTRPEAVFGAAPALAANPARMSAFLSRVHRAHVLGVTNLLRSDSRLRIGYGFGTPNVSGGYAVYAETLLPANRHSRLSANSAFADLNYVLFLGRTRRPAALLVTNMTRFPVTGRQATDAVPFGDRVFTLVVTPRSSLGGTFFEDLPWLILGAGIALSLAAALLTDRLVRRRRSAEQLAQTLDRIAGENRRLYAEQRGIADTLQHALLPAALPALAGLQTASRYVPGATGVEIGGDWYDLVVQDGDRALIVVGDVAGRGVPAATTMASLRFAMLAYATDGDEPAELLAKLARFAERNRHDYFATVLCVKLDLARRTMALASAGHLPPLLLSGSRSEFPPLRVGAPIGAGGDSCYEQVSVPLPREGTLIAFTDGLVERRDEALDDGLARLRRVAAGGPRPLEDLLTALVTELTVEGAHEDDTAILAVRWDGGDGTP